MKLSSLKKINILTRKSVTTLETPTQYLTEFVHCLICFSQQVVESFAAVCLIQIELKVVLAVATHLHVVVVLVVENKIYLVGVVVGVGDGMSSVCTALNLCKLIDLVAFPTQTSSNHALT